ncbi:MAG: glycosyltransferase family 4 protein, partial [Clostridia bacterium]|nr:glycosyltransferase family 4 protein [Clostridia bacterium]
MNIMFLIFSYHTGGIERLLIDMTNTLVKKGESVSVCIINDTYDKELLSFYHSEVDILYLNRPVNTGSRLNYMMEFASLVNIKNIDVLHCQDVNCVIFASIAKFSRPSMKIFDTVHDTFAFGEYSAFKIFFEKRLCHCVISISESVKKTILKRGVPEKKIRVVYNAIDTKRFPLHHKAGAFHNPPVLGMVARIAPKLKGQDILIEALALLSDEFPTLECRFAGAPAKDDEADYQSLLQLVDHYGLSKRVAFLGDIKNVSDFLRDIDIFILPSRKEGFGISLIEAMSTGLPCIASDNEGPAEIITDQTLGLLFSCESAQALAD